MRWYCLYISSFFFYLSVLLLLVGPLPATVVAASLVYFSFGMLFRYAAVAVDAGSLAVEVSVLGGGGCEEVPIVIIIATAII